MWIRVYRLHFKNSDYKYKDRSNVLSEFFQVQLGTSFTYFGGGEGAGKAPTLGDE